MTESIFYEQVGRFLYAFQHVDAALAGLSALMALAGTQAIASQANQPSFEQRADLAYELFTRLAASEALNAEFRTLMDRLKQLAARRDDMLGRDAETAPEQLLDGDNEAAAALHELQRFGGIVQQLTA